LEANGIKPIITDEKYADEAISKFIKDKLEEKDLTDCCGHGHHH